jgi:hypothetical protein
MKNKNGKVIVRNQKHFSKKGKWINFLSKYTTEIKKLASQIEIKSALKFILYLNKELNVNSDSNLVDLLQENFSKIDKLGGLVLLAKSATCNAVIEVILRFGSLEYTDRISEIEIIQISELAEFVYSLNCTKQRKNRGLQSSDIWRFDLEYFIEKESLRLISKSTFLEIFIQQNYKQIPSLSTIELKMGSMQTKLDIATIYSQKINTNAYLQKKITVNQDELNYIEKTELKLENLIENIRNKDIVWSKLGSELEDIIWGAWVININGEYSLIPYHNLLLNMFSFKFVLNSQRVFNYIDGIKWFEVENQFEKWIRNKFKKN